MTHSTCCKAEVKKDLVSDCCHADFDPWGYEKEEGIWQERCIKCGKLCEPIYTTVDVTPPPVPSEIEGEIEKILDNRFYGFGGSLKERVWDYRGAIDDLTALITHHTSVQMEERIRQFQLLYGRFNSDTGELMDYKTNEYGENPVNLLIKFLTAQAAEGEGE